MDDDMIDLKAGNAELRRRLDAYAEARLSPDPAATSRIRARVLAVAHRQADLERADTGLAVLPRPTGDAEDAPMRPVTTTGARRRAPWRRAASVLLAASLGLSLVVGTALAARPGGPLYESRVWAETLTLPSDPSARAVAELERLTHRLQEAVTASQAGDPDAAAAALTAYEAITEQASTGAIIAGDTVASAALQAGVARNIDVLRGLADRLPERASLAISAAIERAIARSDRAIEAIGRGRGNGNGSGAGGGSGAQPTDRTPAGPSAKPTKEPPAKPTNEPTAKPQPTSKPDKTPPGDGKPPEPPGGGGGGNDQGGGGG
jgi:hypothetical protein